MDNVIPIDARRLAVHMAAVSPKATLREAPVEPLGWPTCAAYIVGASFFGWAAIYLAVEIAVMATRLP